MKRLVLGTIATFVLMLLPPSTAGAMPVGEVARAVPALESVRTARGDTVVFDNVRHTADLSPAHSGWVELKPHRNASGVLVCAPAGDYGYGKSQATNAYGQTLVWEFWVGFNGQCGPMDGRVRFRMRLSCKGNVAAPWCNFDSDNAALMAKNCVPILSCPAGIVGNKNFNYVPKVTSARFTGTWHLWGQTYMSSDNHFHVHFLNPDHQGVDHAGCSHWIWPNEGPQDSPGACAYASP